MCRTHKAFETLLKKGAKGTEYILPTETLVMTNVVVDFKNQVQCSTALSTQRAYSRGGAVADLLDPTSSLPRP